MAYILQNKNTKDFIDNNGDWTVIRSMAKRFPTREEAIKYMNRPEFPIFADELNEFMKIIKEGATMKGLKEFIKAKKLNEDKITVIHTKNGKVDYIEKGEMVGGRLIRDAGIDFKDFVGMDPEEAKNSLVKFSRFDPKNIIIEGCKKVQEAGNIKMHRDIDDVDVIIEPDGSYTFWKDHGKTKGAQNRSLHGQEGAVKELGALGYKLANKLNEATSNLREGFGELEVYTSFGPGFGVQIYPSRNGELTAHVGYVSNGSSNGIYKKELKTETELKAIDEIKIADLKGIERVLKKHLDALDSDLQKILKQYGYK